MRALRKTTYTRPALMPPCWKTGSPCPNQCAERLYERVVSNHTALHGPWAGWRMAGWQLVSPHGERIDPRTLDRWLWRHSRMFPR